ncbi:MAG: sulfur oxidation c-type cytochrome SoxX [Burkholderiaceae bacterium]
MNTTKQTMAVIAGASLLIVSGAGVAADDLSLKTDPATVKKVLQASFSATDSASLDRLEQSEAQIACTANFTTPLEAKKKEALQNELLAQVKYPADGKYMGDWKNGQKLAEKGLGMTWRDKPGSQNYGNCYACHQLETAQLSYGNIGPSLNNYGKIRGDSEAILKYTWARLWNSHAFNLCNAMPKFGASGILKESELKDLMALLFDPKSVVNE